MICYLKATTWSFHWQLLSLLKYLYTCYSDNCYMRETFITLLIISYTLVPVLWVVYLSLHFLFTTELFIWLFDLLILNLYWEYFTFQLNLNSYLNSILYSMYATWIYFSNSLRFLLLSNADVPHTTVKPLSSWLCKSNQYIQWLNVFKAVV